MRISKPRFQRAITRGGLCSWIASLILLLSQRADVSGAVYLVNTTSDTVVSGACTNSVTDCSLRSAIGVANSQPGADVIQFNLPAGSIINLSNALPDIFDSVSIEGPGASNLTVRRDSGGDYRVFNVAVANAGVVSFSGLSISNGSISTVGGGIAHAAGTLNVNDCVISGNIAQRGGGIGNNGSGTVNVTNTTLAQNLAGESGGGIFNHHGTINVVRCTLRDNRADQFGVGDSSAVGGGGIANGDILVNVSGFVNVTNSTFSGNQAFTGGGIANAAGGIITVSNCTLSKNYAYFSSSGGGIANSSSSSATVKSTIIALSLNGPNNKDVSGAFTSGGFNLIGRRDGSTGFTAPTDQTGTILSPRDPLLDPAGLRDNGGPSATIALQGGSPALDKGNRNALTGSLTSDQRGQPRPFDDPAIAPASGGDDSDIGAYEAQVVLQSGRMFVVNTTSDHDDGACGALDCTLREAIGAANNQMGMATIRFAPSVAGTIQLESALPNLRSNMSIEGPGAHTLTVGRNSTAEFRIFTISNGSINGPTVSIAGLTITNGQVPYNDAGGGILNDHGDLSVTNCIVTGNSGTRGGGLCSDIMGADGSVVVTNTTFSNNAAPAGYGGAIFTAGGSSGNGSSSLTNCTFSANNADFGGALYNAGSNSGTGTLLVTNCTVSDNAAPNGGGIFNYNFNGTATVTLRNTILNTGSSGANLVNSGGSITSQGHNLSNDSGSGLLTASGDQINTNPQLGPLQDDGGPTPTHALLAGSPAINAADNAFAPGFDQRGFLRIGTADIGAFEFNGIELRITSIARSGNDIVITFNAAAGKTFRLDAKDLLSDNDWTELADVPPITPSSNGGAQLTHAGGATVPRRFYRVRLVGSL